MTRRSRTTLSASPQQDRDLPAEHCPRRPVLAQSTGPGILSWCMSCNPFAAPQSLTALRLWAYG